MCTMESIAHRQDPGQVEATDAPKNNADEAPDHEPTTNTMSRTPPVGDQDDMSPDINSIFRYFRNMEQRLKSLELQMAKLTGSAAGHDERTPSAPGLSLQSTSSSAIPKILRLNRDEFESSVRKDKAIHAIEILVEDTAVTKVRIRSQQLLKLFKDVMRPDIAPDPSKSLVMVRPFKALMVLKDLLKHRSDLVSEDLEAKNLVSLKQPHKSKERLDSTAEPAEASETTEPEIGARSKYVETLLEVIKLDLSKDHAAYSSLRKRSADRVSFLDLWYLFQPGDVIVDGKEQSQQAYRVLSVHENNAHVNHDAEEDLLEEIRSTFVVDCFYIGHDGTTYGPIQKPLSIQRFLGMRSITSLPIVPIESIGGDMLRDRLIRRGMRFSSFKAACHRYYAGMTLDKEISEELDGAVMIDTELYYRENPGIAPKIGLSEFTVDSGEESCDSHIDDKVDKYLTEKFLETHPEYLTVSKYNGDGDADTLDNKQLMLLPNSIWGFYLRGRKWHALDVSKIEAVLYPKDAFDYLVLPSGHKQILASLVMTYKHEERRNRPEIDVVTGKGKGLIMLFHGPPGVGKTSTAECLAAYSKRPLFPITAADIGITPNDVAMCFHNIFSLAQRWGCILLFDEADIILEARGRADFARNAIVSVFLRFLEYYSGILVMTTTRVGTIDEAFQSRIQVVLYFPTLERDSFMKIWEIALRRLRERNIYIEMSSIMRFLDQIWHSYDRKLNGRDIHNTIRSALALAEDEARREGKEVHLSREHIEAVLGMSNEFDKYMTAVHGGSDSVRARRVGDRDDNWDKPKYVSRAGSKPLYTTSRLSDRLIGRSRDASDDDTD